MLTECRTSGEHFPIPKFTVEKRDVEEFMEALRGFHEEFRDCFSRSEPRENFLRYMVGQLSELERKSIEPIALQVEGGECAGAATIYNRRSLGYSQDIGKIS